MNKSQLVSAMAERTGASKNSMNHALDAFIESVTNALKAGDNVALVGFGTFEVRQRAARAGRNPATGAVIQIAAMKALVFKVGKSLKDAVNS